LSKASTFRILHSLEKGQWVICDPDTGMYKIGYKLLELGLSLLSHITIKVVSMRHLSELRDITGETVGLSLRIGNERLFIEEMQSNHELRYITPLGKKFSLWYGAVGKVILANMKETEIAAILDELKQLRVLRLPSGKLIDLDNLRTELAKIKRQGYAVSSGEREPGTSAVAAAIFNHHDEVLGAISVVGPADRFNKARLKKYSVLVSESAKNITQHMGATVSQ
jgi:DNA-binding IclR family transcriptional regulator